MSNNPCKTLVACWLCEYWQAKDFDGVHWNDEAAVCGITFQETLRMHMCKEGSMLTSAFIAAKNEFAQKAVSKAIEPVQKKAVLEDAMAQWYEQHQAQFQDVGHLRTEDDELTDEVSKSKHSDEHYEVEGVDILQPAANGDRLYNHQVEDIMRFKDCPEQAEFAEMGCGKSAILLRITAYKYLLKYIDSLLVIAPNDVHRQWAMEQIPKWLPDQIDREVQCFGGRGGAKNTYPFQNPNALHIVCVNIDTFSTPSKWCDIAEWVNSCKCFIILDEATSIKNVSSKRAERILYEFNDIVRKGKRIISSTVKTPARAILTGTPITNAATDLWALMEFLRPNYFNRNWYSFRGRYAMLATITTAYGSTQILLTEDLWKAVKNCENYEQAYAMFGVSADTYSIIQQQDCYKGAYKHEEELRDAIKPVSVFRILKDCVDMPEQSYIKRTTTMSDVQTRAYKSMESELLAMYGGATTTAANKLSALIRLSQISSGFIVQGEFNFDPENFALTGEEEDLEPGQVKWLGDSVPKLEMMYQDIEGCSKPTIVVTRFSAEAAKIYDDLQKKYKTLLYTGWKKTGDITDFQRGDYEVLVANSRCISRGFNLQNACSMFFYSNTFSLEDRLQLEGRIFRIGQRRPCVYTDYTNADTVDIKIVGALRQKRQLLNYMRGSRLEAFISEEDEITKIEEAS